MASAVEQLAKNASWGSFSKATELKRRILFVLGALLVFRLGTYIPIPGIDPDAWNEIFNRVSEGGSLLDNISLFSGGALERMSIFALNIFPYISASIIMQLAAAMVPKLEAIKKEGQLGQMKINQYTRYLTVLLATVQAYGLAVGLENLQGSAGAAVIDPGMFFRVSTVITIVGGTVFLMWLGEQITARGIGNGISLIIFAGIVAQLPLDIVQLLQQGRTGQIGPIGMVALIAGIIAIIAFVVYMERAHRRVVVQYPKRQMGNKMMMGDTNHIPLKINYAGVIPAIFASALIFLPITLVGFSGAEGGDFTAMIARHLQPGAPTYMIMYGLLLVFFCFFYVSIQFNVDDQADQLRRSGGFIPGIRPGKSTADHLDFVMTRITTIGAAYLVFVCLLPEYVFAETSIRLMALTGTSLLIVVSVTLDTVGQVQSHLVAHQYEGLLKKSNLTSGGAKAKGRRNRRR